MNFKKAVVVYQKELLEMLRDRRTLFTTLILPVILYPLLFIGMSSIMSRQTAVIEKRGAAIVLRDSLMVRNELSLAVKDTIYSELQRTNYFNPVFVDHPTPQKLYADKEIQAIVTLADSTTQSGLQTYRVAVQYDASGERGSLVFSKVQEVVRNVEKGLVTDKLLRQNVDPRIMDLFDIERRDTSTTQKKMGMFLGMLLPYMMILMLVAGASTVAADLVAGEKERKTLETLLVASVKRGEIVLGKYLTIITMAMVNVMVNLISISLSARYLLSQSGLDTSGTQLPVKAFLILLLALLPLATLFAAILLSVSTFSRNMKEARSYEQPIMIGSMVLAMVSFFPSVEINTLLALIPIVNIALLFKAVMINEYQLLHLLLAIGVTVILDLVAIWMTVKLFTTESVLFRTEEEGSLKQVRTRQRSLFNSYYGLLYFALALVALFYLGTAWQGKDLLQGLVKTQLLIILLPVFVVLRIFKLKPVQMLRLKLPRLTEVVLIPFIAIPAALIVALVAQYINTVFPFPQDYLENMQKLFQMDASLLVLFAVIALAPGICEEILFRGFLVRFYENKGIWFAILISALLFAVFHLDPFRLLPTFVLGILLGYLTLRSGSIVNAMLSHTINNGLALLVVSYAGTRWLQPFITTKGDLEYWLLAPALLLLVAALWAFHKITAPKEM